MIISCHELMPVINDALARGQIIRVEATGTSMQPFIYNNDTIELRQKLSQLKIGEIVLAELPQSFYVAHRIVKLEDGCIYLRGDNQMGIQGPIFYDNVIAIVTASYHNGKTRRHDKGFWRILGILWIKIYKVTPAIKVAYRLPRKIASFSFKAVFGVNFRVCIKRLRRRKK